jgi:caa(3)-type oxidase subunit IV
MTNVEHQAQPVSSYINIWLIILVLFGVTIAVSQISPSRPLLLAVAFGIAVVQAILVAAYFMHLKGERPYIHYLLYSMLVAMMMLYFGTQADVRHFSGEHWTATDTMRIINEYEEHPISALAHNAHAAHNMSQEAHEAEATK